MTVLGAVLAGGQSRRFGSDKALARIGERTLLENAVARLGAICDGVVVVGRDDAPAPTAADWPRAGMGPLGGIAGALRHARDEEFDAVLTCGVDTLGLPDDILARLSPAPRHLAQQPVVGLWPVTALPALEAILRGDGSHAVRAFADAIGSEGVHLPSPPANINTPADLAAAEARDGI